MKHYIGVHLDPEFGEEVVEGVYAEDYMPELPGVTYYPITELEKTTVIERGFDNNRAVNGVLEFSTPKRFFAIMARISRNRLLNSTDWTQGAGGALSPEQIQSFTIFRQALRDVPQQADFPENVVWPVAPAI